MYGLYLWRIVADLPAQWSGSVLLPIYTVSGLDRLGHSLEDFRTV